MTESAKAKDFKFGALIVAVAIAVVCAAVAVAQGAFGISFIHSEEAADTAGSGTIFVVVTVDRTQVGKGITTGLVLIPENSTTVETVLNEGVLSGENRSTTKSHLDYSYDSVAQALEGSDYEVAVYAASSQEPGAEAKYTSEPIGDETYTELEEYDGVYITVTG